MLIQSTDVDFNKNIAEWIAIVDFYADWCWPCKVMLPRLENFAANNPNVKVLKHNVETQPWMPQTFQVRSIPTLYVFHNGKPFSRFVWVVDEKTLSDEIAKIK